MDERESLQPGEAVLDEGIACDPGRVITEHDLVIFVAKTANLTVPPRRPRRQKSARRERKRGILPERLDAL